MKTFPALSVIRLKPSEPATTLPFRHINKPRQTSPFSTPKLQPESTSLQSDVDESERMIIDDDNDYNQKPRSKKSPRITRNLNFDFAANPMPSQPKPKRKGVVLHLSSQMTIHV